MTTHEVKRSIARSVAQHTILAAFSTADRHGFPYWIAGDLQADLHELAKLESSPLVDAAKTLVGIAIKHSISPSETTYSEAREARDVLGDIMIRTKEVKG